MTATSAAASPARLLDEPLTVVAADGERDVWVSPEPLAILGGYEALISRPDELASALCDAFLCSPHSSLSIRHITRLRDEDVIEVDQVIDGFVVDRGELIFLLEPATGGVHGDNGRTRFDRPPPDPTPTDSAAVEFSIRLHTTCLDATLASHEGDAASHNGAVELGCPGVVGSWRWDRAVSDLVLVLEDKNAARKLTLSTDGRVLNNVSLLRQASGHSSATVRRTLPSTSQPEVYSGTTANITRSLRWYDTDYYCAPNRLYQLRNEGGPHKAGWIRATSPYQRCVPPLSTPQFTSSTAHFRYQANTYYAHKKSRDFAVSSIYPAVSATSSTGIRYVWLGSGNCGFGTKCYNPVTNDIIITSAAGQVGPGTIWHEYGHYIADSYGGFNNVCWMGVDESDAIAETLADCWAFVMARDPTWLTPHTAPNWDRIGRSQVSDDRHRAAPMLYGLIGCGAPGFNHNVGAFFEQAFWEAINDVDCNQSTCAVAREGAFNGSGDIGWTSTETARKEMAIALAYAQLVTPASTTYSAIKTHVYVKLLGRVGTGIANNVNAVFAHHGI